jgi:hypothetical protein
MKKSWAVIDNRFSCRERFHQEKGKSGSIIGINAA